MNKIIQFCKTKKRTIKDIMEKFNIPKQQERTLRRRLKEKKVILKDGRRKVEFE